MAAKRPDETGIYTAEGMVAGQRAGVMAKRREKRQQEFEKQKQAIIAKSAPSIKSISSKFSAYDTTYEKELSVSVMSMRQGRSSCVSAPVC